MKYTRIDINHLYGQSHSDSCIVDAGDRPIVIFDADRGKLRVVGPNIDMEYFDVHSFTCWKSAGEADEAAK